MASDIRTLMDQIETSYLAAIRGLSGPAMVARHDFIQKRMEEIDTCHEKLQGVVGEIATNFVMAAMNIAETRYELEQQKEALS